MGKILFDVGPTTAVVNVGNAQAEKILNDFIELKEGPITGTMQEKLDFTVNWLLKELRDAHIDAIRRREFALVESQLALKYSNWS